MGRLNGTVLDDSLDLLDDSPEFLALFVDFGVVVGLVWAPQDGGLFFVTRCCC